MQRTALESSLKSEQHVQTHIQSNSLHTVRKGEARKTHFSHPHPNHVLCACQWLKVQYLFWVSDVCQNVSLVVVGTNSNMVRTIKFGCHIVLQSWQVVCWVPDNILYYCKKENTDQEKSWNLISAPHTDRNTHCVTLGASRLRSASLLTIARSPPRSEHCCRASVQLNSPGTIWKQRKDSAWYTPSFGQ